MERPCCANQIRRAETAKVERPFEAVATPLDDDDEDADDDDDDDDDDDEEDDEDEDEEDDEEEDDEEGWDGDRVRFFDDELDFVTTTVCSSVVFGFTTGCP